MRLLTKNAKLILNALLNNRVLTITEISNQLDISERAVYEALKSLDEVLADFKTQIFRKARVGVWLEVTLGLRVTLLRLLYENVTESLNDVEVRIHYILVRLLELDDFMTIQELADEMFVSQGTITSDLEKVDQWLKKEHLRVEKVRNKGIRIVVSEKKRREILAQIFKMQKNNHAFFNIIQSILNDEDVVNIEHYIGSQVFKQFKAFELKYIQRIVRILEERTEINFTDEAFSTLVIHIAIALKRSSDGQFVKLPSSTKDSLKTHPLFDSARRFVRDLEDYFETKMIEDEAFYILIHLLGAKTNPDQTLNNSDDENLSLIQQMIHKAENLLDLPLENDGIFRKSLTVHVQASIHRLAYNLSIHNPYLDEIKRDFPIAFEAAIQAFSVLKEQYHFSYNENEIAYIALHIQAAIERYENKQRQSTYRVLLVCSSGVGTSQLLESKFRRVFPGLQIVDVVSLSEARKNHYSADLIVSTINFQHNQLPVITVSPLLKSEEIQLIEQYIGNIKRHKDHTSKKRFDDYQALIIQSMTRVQVRFSNRNRLLSSMCETLVQQGYVTKRFYDTVIQRENISSTALYEVAIPHGECTEVLKNAVVVWTLKNAIPWGKERTKIVILLAIKKETTGNLKEFYEALYDLINDREFKHRMLQQQETDALYNLLVRGN